MEYVPFILFVTVLAFVVYAVNQKSSKELENVGLVVGGIGAFIVIGIIIFNLGNKGIKKGTEYLDDRSAKKERCAERAEDASNSYAAKKIYKACMSNY